MASPRVYDKILVSYKCKLEQKPVVYVIMWKFMFQVDNSIVTDPFTLHFDSSGLLSSFFGKDGKVREYSRNCALYNGV